MKRILLLTADDTLASELAKALHPASLQTLEPSASFDADRLTPLFDAVICDSRKQEALMYAPWDCLPSLLLVNSAQAKTSSSLNCFTEPFSAAEIWARLQLLKCTSTESRRDSLPSGELVICLTSKLLKGMRGQTRIGGAGVRLAELLLTNVDVGKSFSLSEIASYTGCTPNAKAVRMVVCRLRRKIARVGSSACIVATRGPSGYKAVFPDGCGELVRVVR